MFVIHGYMYCELQTVLLIILCQKTVLVNQKMCVVYHRSGKIIIAERIV